MDEQTLNDLLECSVCLDRLKDSKVLSCQHTFCTQCLEVILKSRNELRCPECRLLVTIPIADLPPNVLLMRILEGMKNTTTEQNNIKTPKNLANLQNNTGITTNNTNSKLITNHAIKNSEEHKSLVIAATQVPHARALFDFSSKESDDLSFKKGDVILLRRRIDQNWCIGKSNGKEGAFPLNHVQIIINLPIPQCKALYDFRMGPNEEEGCLSFKKSAIIQVIRRVDQNWAEGRSGDVIGIFPIAFVEMNTSARQLMDASIKYLQQTGPSRLVPPKPTIESDSSSTITTSPNSSSTSNTSSNSSTAPSSPTTNLNASTAQQTVKSRDIKEKRHSLTVTGNTSQQQIAIQTNRHSAEILGVVGNQDNNPSVEPPKPSSRQRSQTVKVNSSNHQVFPATFIALYPYKPQKADELELKKGAVYFVTERCQDGWFKGTNRSHNKSGVFPGNYVAIIKNRDNNHTHSSRSSEQSSVQSVQLNSQNTSSRPPPELPPRNIAPSSSTSQSVWSKPLNHVDALFNRKTAQTSSNNIIKNEKTSSSSGSGQTSSSKTDVKEKKEQSSAVSLMMRKLTNMKRSKSPTHPPSYSNPVFDDSAISQTTLNTSSKHNIHLSHPVHVRSGSCPSQLLQSLPLEFNTTTNLEENSVPMLFGSQRVKGHKDRPSLQNIRNNSEAGGRLKRIQVDSTGAGTSATSNYHQSHGPNHLPSTAYHRKSQSLDASTISSQLGGTPSKSKSPHSHIRERVRCIVPYPPNSEYELELHLGDIVFVTKKRDNGWYKGTHQRTGEIGLFPASFVEPDI